MAHRLSKNDRVLGLIALTAASSFAVGGIAFVVTGDVSSLDAAKSHLVAAHDVAIDLNRSISREQSALDAYVLYRSPETLKRFTDAIEQERTLAGRIEDAATGAPDVRSALEDLEAASLDWKRRVAAPAIAAVETGDQAALAAFARQAGSDHLAIDAGADAVDSQLDRVGLELEQRQSSTDLGKNLAVAVALGVFGLAFGVALVVVRRFGRALEFDARQASVLNQFTELTSFAADDRAVAVSNLVALGRIASPDASMTHILNRSMDRAVAEASTGDAPAEILPLRALDRCAGVLRGTMYVADDLADELSVHCPIYPAAVGTLACVPLDRGEMVGAVHLYWRRPNALPSDRRASIARVTEHAALSIGNRRLLAALQGQANTDPRTGLANSRAFDLALEVALATRAGHEPLSVLMLDLDHFKPFNDRHGHPAGDEALKAFGGVLHSCMRTGDIAARYGGEEFAVLLAGVDSAVAATIAERIRARTEATIIALSPGITDHITVSIGFSSAPDHGLDRVTLMRLADEALYRAKNEGRNRVVGIVDPSVAPSFPEDTADQADGPRVMEIGAAAEPRPRRRSRIGRSAAGSPRQPGFKPPAAFPVSRP